MVKFLYILLGIFSTILAIIGIFVPGMPTTIFLIIALWLFDRSSQRLHDWLSKLPLLKGAMINVKNLQEKKAVTRKVKIVSQVCAWTSAIILSFSSIFILFKILIIISAICCTISMIKLKTLK